MMLSPILSIFVFAAFLPAFSTAAAATTSNRSINCYKYERKFADVNFIDVPDEEKDVIQCDQCLSYVCYENNEYILGYGCRENFLKSCNFDSEIEGLIYDARNEEVCNNVEDSDAIVDFCLKNLTCTHNSLKNCIKHFIDDPIYSMGPVYTVANITLKEVATPTTTTPTTTESAFNPDNGNGGKSQNGNSDDSGNKNNPSSANSKMIPFIFFVGIFFFAFFM
uniref:Uncharacterized protein n=1 Tax=Panagrolaimus davidi TaxID=227884 RepID=A0A914Q9C7_9BILA